MPIYKLLYGLFDNNSVPRLLGQVLDTHPITYVGKPRRAAGIIGVGNIVGILLNRDNGRCSVYKSLGSKKGRIGAERKSDNGEDSRKYFQSGSF